MKVLHIAHYDLSNIDKLIFKEDIKNGIEKFLSSLIEENSFDEKIQNFILLFDINSKEELHLIGYDKGNICFYKTYIGSLEKGIFGVINDAVEDVKPSVVHFHYLIEDIIKISNIIKQKYNDEITYLATIHDESFLNLSQKNEKNTDNVNLFLNNMNVLIFPHEIIYDNFLKRYPFIKEKSLIIPNGIKKNEFKLTVNKNKTLNVAFLGRITKEKGLEIIKELVKINPKKSFIKFYVIGSISEPIEGIEVIGYDISKDNLKDIFQNLSIDVVCVTSLLQESFSYTAMEATSSGIPIISFKVGALKNIEKEQRGFLAKEINAQSMLECILKAYEMKFNKKEEWLSLYNKVHSYEVPDIDNMVKKYFDLYLKYKKPEDINKLTNILISQYMYQYVHKLKILQGTLITEKQQLNNEIIRLNEEYKKLLQQNKQTQQFNQRKEKEYTLQIQQLNSSLENANKHILECNRVIEYKQKHFIRNIAGSLKKKAVNFKNNILNFNKNSFNSHADYANYFKQNRANYSKTKVKILLAALPYKPKISILIPVYNAPKKVLCECLDSIMNQYYPNFEVCLVDDCSTKKHVKLILEEYKLKDPRFKVKYREENGHISKTTNDALDMAQGEFIALIDNDDFIEKDALYEFVKLINKHPDADMVYTDEDKVSEDGKVFMHPFFKPEWSPESFFAHMFTCHLGFYRTKIAKEIGGFRTEYNGSQDYDFVLRFTEKTNKIYHIPKILYHWRLLPTSTSSGGDNKDYAYNASIKAKQNALDRKGIDGKVIPIKEVFATYNYYFPKKEDKVSIIIPIKDKVAYLKRLLDSIYQKSTWLNFEIIIVDNKSQEEKTKKYLNKIENEKENVTIINIDKDFNYSFLNNEAAKVAKGNFLLFLNNDTEVITEDWLERLIGQASQKETGAVGARLFYPNDTIQHSGVIVNKQGPYHIYLNTKVEPIYRDFARNFLNYNYMAVTGAALMVEKSKFDLVGGFDENLKVSYNDVDLCVSLYKKGFYNVCRVDVNLYHHESISRGYDHQNKEKMQRLNQERTYLFKKWGKTIEKDPFYSDKSIMHLY